MQHLHTWNGHTYDTVKQLKEEHFMRKMPILPIATRLSISHPFHDRTPAVSLARVYVRGFHGACRAKHTACESGPGYMTLYVFGAFGAPWNSSFNEFQWQKLAAQSIGHRWLRKYTKLTNCSIGMYRKCSTSNRWVRTQSTPLATVCPNTLLMRLMGGAELRSLLQQTSTNWQRWKWAFSRPDLILRKQHVQKS